MKNAFNCKHMAVTRVRKEKPAKLQNLTSSVLAIGYMAVSSGELQKNR